MTTTRQARTGRGLPAAPADALAGVRGYRDRPEHLLVGLMTGTSADAVDAALVRVRGDDAVEIVAYRETPLEPGLRREVLAVSAADVIEPERLMRLDAALGEGYAAAVLELLAGAGVDPRAVDAIGSHGQTVRHVPRAQPAGRAFTMQIGSAAVLAERTGLTVVSDFRARDAAAGGEGAPLVPLVDWWLFRSPQETRVLLNLGGMANLTLLPKGGGLETVLAFDTGPGNAVIDALVAQQTAGGETRDDGGARAARGRASEALLAELLADPFFDAPPPRSTGRERFGAAYAARLATLGAGLGLSADDVVATATELTAASVVAAIAKFVQPRGPVDAVYVSGGGARNPVLMAALARRVAPARFGTLDEIGVEPGAKEAIAFALLAHRTLCGLAGNVVGATGAARPVVLGTITPGAA
jgi:anhydro-N-acetylmuramic acid kinase